MRDPRCLIVNLADVPNEVGWLARQPVPVIAIGEGSSDNADIVTANSGDISQLRDRIERNPHAAVCLVQVLRVVEHFPVQLGMTVESLAYSALQAGQEFRSWLRGRVEAPRLISDGDGQPILLERNGSTITAVLNRPDNRNSLTVEMRDALVELFELVLLDDSIESLHLSARGGCFSVGGELREFGLAPDPVTAHWIRSQHNPARLLAR